MTDVKVCPHLVGKGFQPLCGLPDAEGSLAYYCAHCAVDRIEEMLDEGQSTSQIARAANFEHCGHFDIPNGRCGRCYVAIASLLTFVAVRNRLLERGKYAGALGKVLKHWVRMHGSVDINKASQARPHKK